MSRVARRGTIERDRTAGPALVAERIAAMLSAGQRCPACGALLWAPAVRDLTEAERTARLRLLLRELERRIRPTRTGGPDEPAQAP